MELASKVNKRTRGRPKKEKCKKVESVTFEKLISMAEDQPKKCKNWQFQTGVFTTLTLFVLLSPVSILKGVLKV